MRKIAVGLAAVLLVSGCTGTGTPPPKRAPTRPAVTQAPPAPTWRLATLPELVGPTSALWDVVSVDATHAWAVGAESYSPEKPDDTGKPLILQRDGTGWTRAALPPLAWHGGFNLVAAESPTNVWAVGNQAAPSPEDQVAHVLRYDGTAWREVPFPQGTKGFSLWTGLTVVGGHAWLVGNNGSEVLIEQWDGRSWRSHRSPAECRTGGTSFGGMPNFCTFTAVKAFAPNDIWAAGNGAWKGFKGPLLFHFDGSGWRSVRVGIDNQETAFNALAGRSSAELWAVGEHGLAVRGGGTSFEVVPDAPDGPQPDVAMDPAGQPWVTKTSTAPSAELFTRGAGGWVGTPAPQPPDAIGMSLNAIAATEGSPLMFAVGSADLPTTPRYVRAVLLEYAPLRLPDPSRL
ncbi:hypothetical protein SAMN05421812_11770 [Asanoa hainanensis]|uniref:Uncharacterized protein n=1 Tax=Asanoa hainanensis TaxID=560556 RepID=A0A239PC34_9ACTN|nr:hypothetical protein [Asanoa hainanensis]SNT64513.1 hypothetical protein SAMN05421812_11770 [Asanoa hainanensis]